MRLFLLALAAAAALPAQTPPDWSGIWKADTSETKLEWLKGSDYWLKIDQQGSRIEQKFIRTGPHVEDRAGMTLDTSAPETTNTMRGAPVKTSAKWDGAVLKIAASFTDRGKPASYEETWTRNADGTLTSVRTNPGQAPIMIAWVQQPASAAEVFERPERKAKEVFKNVTVLDLPASMLIPVMQNFTASLGVECGFCHVQGHFDEDGKPAKVTARKMIQMAHGLNDQYFGGHMTVSCYTCHRGKAEPVSHPPR